MPKTVWFGLCMLLSLLTGCMGQSSNPEDTMNRYLDAWRKAQYEEMYDMLLVSSAKEVTKEDFVNRFRKIYEGIEARNIVITPLSVPEESDDKKTDSTRLYPYEIKMDTIAGMIQAKGKIQLEKDEGGEWRVHLTPSYIFPGMQDGDTVRVQTLQASRGEIKDRNGQGIAINGFVEMIGIVPGKLGEDAEKTKAALAERLGITQEAINRKLQASWVKDDLFVPIAYLSKNQASIDYSDLPGVLRKQEKARVYPLGEAAAHLSGYIREATAEEIAGRSDHLYGPGDLIGRAGSEQVYEDILRGRDGKRISIVDATGKTREVLAETAAVNGRDVRLTIDADLQISLYEAIREDAGTAVALHPKTGEILALVSSPAYDPNAFITGMSDEQWDAWNLNPDKPFLNRFTKLYSPGSTFKPITAAAGLELGVSYVEKAREIKGLRWSKDSSWGSYYVTRVKDSPKVNLREALLYSDNIYFAQEALEIGADAFLKETGKFLSNVNPNMTYPFPKASLSNHGIKNEIQLADSGYGQGEVVMTPLHLALAYTPFLNDGVLIPPVLDYQEGDAVGSSGISVISAGTAKLIQSMLADVVNHPGGTGYGAKIKGIELAGKTGTAELKNKKEQKGQENGWLVTFDTAESKLLLAMMVEGVEGRGGSGYVVKKARPVLEEYYRK